MVKNVYQKATAVTEYDRSHGLLGQDGTKIPDADQFFKDLAKTLADALPNGRDVSLIDLGVGHGGFVFLPLLSKLSSASRNVTLTVGVDNSNHMLMEYKKRWADTFSSRILKETKNLPGAGAKGDFFFEADIECLLASCVAKEQSPRFDVVVLTGVLHHVLNWREVLTTVVEKLLCKDGMIVLAERDMDADFFDGNFCQHLDFIESASNLLSVKLDPWRRIWLTVYGVRAKVGIPWEPEVRVSDATPCIAFLLDVGFVHMQERPITGLWKNIYRRTDLERWLQSPSLSNFSRGVTDEVRTDISKVVKDSPASEFQILESWRYYALRRP